MALASAAVAGRMFIRSAGLTPKVSGAGRSAATEGYQQGPGQWRSHGPCWRPLDRPVRLVDRCAAMQVHGNSVRFECPQKLDKLRVRVERPVRLGHVGEGVEDT